MLARHVSDLTGPSSGAFYKLYSQIRYVVIRVYLVGLHIYYTMGNIKIILSKKYKNIYKKYILEVIYTYIYNFLARIVFKTVLKRRG